MQEQVDREKTLLILCGQPSARFGSAAGDLPGECVADRLGSRAEGQLAAIAACVVHVVYAARQYGVADPHGRPSTARQRARRRARAFVGQDATATFRNFRRCTLHGG